MVIVSQEVDVKHCLESFHLQHNESKQHHLYDSTQKHPEHFENLMSLTMQHYLP
jgi:hypothetical protein